MPTAPTPTPAVEARGLTKSFGAAAAVRGVDLTVGPGERVALLGPNGAGKTTTLLMLLGVITPDAGTIEVCGLPLPRRRAEAMARVGFVAGYLPLPEHLRVREALGVFARLYGCTDPDGAVQAGLDRFRVAHLADRPCEKLSSGQKTLCAIVKATLHRPALLVLDEPTASLDPDVADRVRSVLLEVHREDGSALLVTSHNMAEVERLAERVVFLHQGRVVADGAPAEVAAGFERDNLEDVFLALARDHEEEWG